MKQHSETGRAYASILLAAALWGTIGLWNRKLMGAGVSPTTIVALRNFGGMLLLVSIFTCRNRRMFRIEKAHFKYFIGTGIFSLLLFTVCYFSCQQLCSLAVAGILLYTAPAIVVVLSAILWKEPITRQKLTALVLTLVGCALVCGIFSGGQEMTTAGILLGLGAGFAYALYSIFARYALVHYESMTVTLWTFIVAGPISLLVAKPAELAAMTPDLWLTAVGLVIFATVLPYVFYTWGLQRVEAGRASIMASLEPVVAALVGVLVFGEPMSGMTLAGIVCVLAGVCILR